MKPMTKREKILMIILVVILVGFCYYKFILEPVQSEISSVEDTTATEQTLIDNNLKVAKKIKKMEAEIEEIKASGDYRDVPNYNNDTLLMKELNVILSAADNYSLGFGKVTTSGNIAARPTSLNFATGSYDEARAILDKLNESDNVNTVGDISITLNTDNEGVGSVSVYCSITFYELLA